MQQLWQGSQPGTKSGKKKYERDGSQQEMRAVGQANLGRVKNQRARSPPPPKPLIKRKT